ncbi:MsnO8 family LLM class oxidoreductase [Ornithinibacillus sp. L9]|uniref:MsnO8 family LLM class oxidoreductase n=1 Tax=Ornithinibacillus caprae TaxID=2678566 RepID=A0A6N8FKI4_9BACI|nr:LLM class flavin-dependent oxidoreductase [Ornithinibacillus caprae]MUK89226.1 MsnO8 family LLM class oxidoreductase [Ornithinibacillus caprae]
MKLSILDQSPIVPGKTAKDALQQSIDLAQLGEKLGYTRYWIAEHHDLNGLACPAPEVMLGIIGAQTKTIRIGAGAVLLPHYKPYKVAETFNLLATLYPGRIDLGLGRSPGGSAEASIALSGDFLANVKEMPKSIDELQRFLHNDFPADHVFSKVKPTPAPMTAPITWLLGTSEKSADLAAEKGMAYAFGHFMSDQDGPIIVEKYKKAISKVNSIQSTKVIVAIIVYCAETFEEAEELAMSSLIASIKRDNGDMEAGLATMEEIKGYSLSDEEKFKVENMKRKMIIGTPDVVRAKLQELEKQYEAEEFMILTNTYSYEKRNNSYELLARELLRK